MGEAVPLRGVLQTQQHRIVADHIGQLRVFPGERQIEVRQAVALGREVRECGIVSRRASEHPALCAVAGRRRRCEGPGLSARSEEHTSELPSLMRISYAVFCLKKKKK